MPRGCAANKLFSTIFLSVIATPVNPQKTNRGTINVQAWKSSEPSSVAAILIMAAEWNIIKATSLARCEGRKSKDANMRDSNAQANSTSPKIILYMGYPCCHSMQLTGWEKIRVWWGESSRCDNCDKSRQSVVLRNTAQISPSLFFFSSGWQLNVYHMQYLFSSCVRLSSCPREYKECHLLE